MATPSDQRPTYDQPERPAYDRQSSRPAYDGSSASPFETVPDDTERSRQAIAFDELATRIDPLCLTAIPSRGAFHEFDRKLRPERRKSSRLADIYRSRYLTTHGPQARTTGPATLLAPDEEPESTNSFRRKLSARLKDVETKLSEAEAAKQEALEEVQRLTKARDAVEAAGLITKPGGEISDHS